MTKTLDFPGGKFLQMIRLTPEAPRTHYAVTREIDYPYRYSWVKITKLFRWGIVRGEWQDSDTSVENHLMTAIGGRELGER